MSIDIDDDLMKQALRLSEQRSKKATVEEALRLFVRLRRQAQVDRAFGCYRWMRSREGRSTE